jgi:hypothetical protein
MFSLLLVSILGLNKMTREGTIDGDIVEFNYEKFIKTLFDDIQRNALVDTDSLEQIKQHFGVK